MDEGAAKPRPGGARARVRASFLKKVETLEGWVRDGRAPEGCDWPRGPVALRRWACEELGLVPWSSPNVASAGGNADLRARFDAAVSALGRLDPGKRKKGLEGEVATLRRRIAALVAQNVALQLACRTARQDAEKFRDLYASAARREAEATRTLATLHPLAGVRLP